MDQNKQTGTQVSHVEAMAEKPSTQYDTPTSEDEREERVTFKAWASIFFLALSFGTPFWATPVTAAISAQLFARFGSGALSAWVIPCITVSASVTILLFGANSDLFGRRSFVLAGNVLTAIGYAVCARATSTNMLIAGLCLNGCGSGIAGICLIAVPELMPNKYRHIGVILADLFVYIMIVIGPVVGRFAILSADDRWQWLYWAGFISCIVTIIGLFFLYHPPKHPRGVSWKDALRGLDWVGGVLFTIGAVLVLVGMVYTSYLESTDTRVLVTLCVGFAFIIAFGCWERFSKVRFPLCPNEIFVSHHGREFTVPFCLTFIVVGFFYGMAIIYPTMLNAFYIDASTPTSTQLLLTLPVNLALPFGSLLLTLFGSKLGHWKWQLVASVSSLVLWGSLLAMITPFNKVAMITFATLGQLSYGWAAYLSVTYTQLGVPQEMLGISGGLAGTARYAGGAVASACYSTAIANGISRNAPGAIAAAALENNVPHAALEAVGTAASTGVAGLVAIDGVSETAAEAISLAYKYAVAKGLRDAALASVAFGVVGILFALACEDITPKMTSKIEVFLENDTLADRNKFH